MPSRSWMAGEASFRYRADRKEPSRNAIRTRFLEAGGDLSSAQSRTRSTHRHRPRAGKGNLPASCSAVSTNSSPPQVHDVARDLAHPPVPALLKIGYGRRHVHLLQEPARRERRPQRPAGEDLSPEIAASKSRIRVQPNFQELAQATLSRPNRNVAVRPAGRQERRSAHGRRAPVSL